MRLPKSRTAEAVPLVAATAPAELSAMFASSSSATMLGSVQFPEGAGAPAAIADVSARVVLAAAVVSAAYSFLEQATIASVAMARVVSLKPDPLINIVAILQTRW